MNEWLAAILLGIIQGVTEFLPISSSGHVLLFEEISGYQRAGLADAINVGTFIAVSLYYHKDIYIIIKNQVQVFANIFRKSKENKQTLIVNGRTQKKSYQDIINDPNIGIKLLIASIPIGLAGKFLDSLYDYENNTFTVFVIGISSIIFGFIFYVGYKQNKGYSLFHKWLHKKQDATTHPEQIANDEDKKFDIKKKNTKYLRSKVNTADYITLSLIQVLAIIPGASRSGLSMTGAFFRNIEPKVIAKFIFLMSIIPTGMASLNELILKSDFVVDTYFIVASISCFVSALLTIKFLIKAISTSKLDSIILYRFVFGIGCIGFYFVS